MRDRGLAHLLSVSGLHVTAVVGAVMLLALRAARAEPGAGAALPAAAVAAARAALAGDRLYAADRRRGADGALVHRGAAGAARRSRSGARR